MGRAWPLALTWKDFYFVAGGRRILIAKFAAFFVVLVGLNWLTALAVGPWMGDAAKRIGDTTMLTMLIVAMVEMGLLASRTFQQEMKGKTLPLLIMLPKTTAQIAWSKAAAVFPALIPAVTYFALGALLDFDTFGTAAKEMFTTAAGLYGVMWFILFLHLTSYLSIVIKWGALPLSIFLVYVSQMFILPVAFEWRRVNGRDDDFLTWCVLLLIGLGIIAGLQLRIASRLRKLATQ